MSVGSFTMRRTALLSTLVGLWATVAHAGAPPAAHGLAVDSYTLKNGLRVILHEDHTSPTIVTYVWYQVGSKDEKPGHTGFAHLFEHLMFKGSKHVPDGRFDDLLESAGGWSNGSTTADRTNFFEQVPSSYLELTLYLEADRMAGLWDAMDQAKLDNQRDVVKNERRESYENRPYGMAELAVQQALWPVGHGNHNLTIGSMADLSAASLADVEHFYRTYYVPNDAVLVVAGDFDPKHARALIDHYLGWIPRRPDPPHVTSTSPVTPRAGAADLTNTDRVQASKVVYAWRSPTPFTRQSRDLEAAAQLLAGGKTSRLYRRLVFDLRLCDSVFAYQEPQMLGGEFHIEAVARAGASIADIRATIDGEVAKLAAEPPPAPELERAKRMMEVDKLQGLESLVARADQLAEYQAYTGTPDYLARDLALLHDTTAASVSRAVATWLRPDARVVMTVTPAAAKAPAKAEKQP